MATAFRRFSLASVRLFRADQDSVVITARNMGGNSVRLIPIITYNPMGLTREAGNLLGAPQGAPQWPFAFHGVSPLFAGVGRARMGARSIVSVAMVYSIPWAKDQAKRHNAL